MQDHEKGKILILKRYRKILSILLCARRVLAIQADSQGAGPDGCQIGSLYVGRVQNISNNIGAAFVEIKKGELTFLPLSEAKDAVLTSRKSDGTIKTGDELLVQIVKEPVQKKLARASAKLSLAGSYVVVERKKGNQAGHIKISSKLDAKYHHLYKNLKPLQDITEHFDLIIRTNAGSLEDVAGVVAEAEDLSAQMEHILNIGHQRTCFSCLYQSEPKYITFIKNCYQSEYDEIITDEKDIYEALLSDGGTARLKIRYYEDSMLPLYKLYSIETRVKELLDKKVWLKSGGYLIIEQTEALVAIDVNTGKYEARKNQEETYLKINLEAAEAIAAALRARNLAGMIIVDFINMKKKENIAYLVENMKDFLKKDNIPSYVVDITGLGLMEITRQKKNSPFAEQMRNAEF